jgi:hypothetical protein
MEDNRGKFVIGEERMVRLKDFMFAVTFGVCG